MTPAAHSRQRNRAASIHVRLLATVKAGGEDFNFVLGRYATARWLTACDWHTHP